MDRLGVGSQHCTLSPGAWLVRMDGEWEWETEWMEVRKEKSKSKKALSQQFGYLSPFDSRSAQIGSGSGVQSSSLASDQ